MDQRRMKSSLAIKLALCSVSGKKFPSVNRGYMPPKGHVPKV